MALEPARIDADADKVVRRLARGGYKAYLVGGCVRDLLLDRTPKDFDIATSATPNEIRALFRNCRIIGRRFRLAHIFFGPKIIETSTFRANPRNGDEADLLIQRDNVFGSATEDAQRRDFTINGLFYDVEAEQVIDYVGGSRDLEARLVRTIGNPDIRFQEDPVRMLRAIKFAARLDFEIEARTYAALVRHRGEILKCSSARVLEEIYRLLRSGAAVRSLELLIETGIATVMTPHMAAMFAAEAQPVATHDEHRARAEALFGAQLDEEETSWIATWAEQPQAVAIPPLKLSFLQDEAELARRRARAWRMLELLDEQVGQKQELGNALLLAAIIYPFLSSDIMEPGVRPNDASAMIDEVSQPLMEELRVARRDIERVRQILLAQRRLVPSRRRRGRPTTLAQREYFEDALILYELMARAEERPDEDVEHWSSLRRAAADEDDDAGRRRRRRRRGGRRRRRGDMDMDEDEDMDTAVHG